MRLRSLLALATLLLPSAAAAATFTVTLASGDGQFPGLQPAPFGNRAGPVDVELTPDVPVQLPIEQFTNFRAGDVFPYEPGASTTVTQTLTVNGVSTTVTRTLTLVPSGPCQLLQALSPVTVTVDLGVAGTVTLTLATASTLAYPCFGGVPAPNTLLVVPGTTQPIVAGILDDFVFYKVKTSKGTPKPSPFGPVTLADGVGAAAADVTGLVALGLPAGTGGGAFDPVTHLLSHRLKRRKTAPKFRKLPDAVIPHACGRLHVTLLKPESLLVPVNLADGTLPPPPSDATSEVDHFVCYKAKLQKKRVADKAKVAVLPKRVQVDAGDDFQTRRYDVTKITRVCLPAAKSGAPLVLQTGAPHPITPAAIRHPARHLVCYQAKPAKSVIAQDGCGPLAPKDKGAKIVPAQPKHQRRLGLEANGQFGAATIDTAKELELCVPVTVELPPV